MINQLQRRFMAHLDPMLLGALGALMLISLILMYSASGGSMERVLGQLVNVMVAFAALWLVANMPLHYLIRSAVPIYIVGMMLLLGVAFFGEIQNGARRWLNLGVATIQPSELMKIAVPLMMAWYFERHEATLALKNYVVAALILAVPFALILRQPDLGTALLICASGFYVLFLAGLSWRVILGLFISAAASAPFLWHALHGYQRQRILMLLDPTEDPLGKGYHTIQGMIAVGSGGILGKGYLNGTQTHLEFLPERTTDFIFAVFSEEFGLLGNLVLLSVYLFIMWRGFVITANASTYFTRLMAGSITLTFFTYAFVNMGMVTGILPVVGVPLPLVSYGGTSMLTLSLGFGMLMSIHSHKTLVQS
ncbi:MAG: rod shape-determining protein RodA [Gallionellales bacterium 35-53-114]|jgi:rod shape determining protein RodA|nr:MAG: rod shape-determining protein RodA [Gallionellales bacterium 35-53-114]OYZ64376.1 MAG: rod shape-determining protein RodA [Gallionellales bacterium 24-53-125]OZB10315.1 MAG: rod shape-determining protein RodA [Gallionellales bacterium 39-52-133]HQS56917.1 rod shape-determining protein RodA [Gallionellaceae bacterium]HQS75299.1 rod shape-determining protein RodA [Gallionellaceae bacterium]